MSPLEAAAIAAEAEADGLRAEALHAVALEDTSVLLYDVATDAIDAYHRARERATLARQLADQAAGLYNPGAEIEFIDAAPGECCEFHSPAGVQCGRAAAVVLTITGTAEDGYWALPYCREHKPSMTDVVGLVRAMQAEAN